MEMKLELPEIAKKMLAKEAQMDLRTIDAKLHMKFAEEQLTYVKTVHLEPKVRKSISHLIKQ